MNSHAVHCNLRSDDSIAQTSLSSAHVVDPRRSANRGDIMKPRKVSEAYIRLDSQEVITAKDQAFWRATQSGTSTDSFAMRMAGLMAERRDTGNNGTEGQSSKDPNIPRNVGDTGQSLTLNPLPLVGDSSAAADIASPARVTQSCHAISNFPQNASNLPLRESSEKQQNKQVHANSNTTGLIIDGKLQGRVITGASKETVLAHLDMTQDKPQQTTASLGAKNTNIISDIQSGPTNSKTNRRKKPCLILSQPRPPKGKSYTLQLQTEVDWNEDLRPTPKESFQADSDANGTCVSSPAPGSASALDKTSKEKRKKPKSRPGSQKRRKSERKKATSARGEDWQSPYSLATINPALPVSADSLISCPRPDLDPHDGQTEGPREEVLCNPSYLPGPEKASADGPCEPLVREHEIIEISSRASVSLCSSSPKDEIHNVTGDNAEEPRDTRDGRGKAVGQKLFDALRSVQLHSQSKPEFKTEAHPKKSGIAIDHGKSSFQTRHTHVHSAQEPPNHALLRPEADTQRTRLTSATDLKDFKPDMFQPMSPTQHLQTKIHAMETEHKTQQECPDLSAAIDDSLEVVHIPDPSVIRPVTRRGNHSLTLQSAIDIACSPGNCSPHSSAEVPNDPPTRALQDDGTEHTPESQRPLLADQTPAPHDVSCSKNARSMPRNSIVDQNGSPRLAAQGQANVKVLQDSTELTNSSTSEYHRNTEASYPTSSSDDRRTWTKFKRDMFLEYGIETHELVRGREQTGLFGNSAPGQTTSAETVLMKNERRSPTGPRMVTPHRAQGISTSEKDTCSLDQEMAMGVSSRAEQNTTLLSLDLPRTSQPLQEPTRANPDPAEWISALQVAQRGAQQLLHETNQVNSGTM